MAELIDKSDETKINQLAMMYAVALTKYGVDIREKFETATQITMAMNEAYLRGRQDEIEKFRVLQSGYEAEIRARAIDEFAEKIKADFMDYDIYFIIHANSVMKPDEAFQSFRTMIDDIAEQLKEE